MQKVEGKREAKSAQPQHPETLAFSGGLHMFRPLTATPCIPVASPLRLTPVESGAHGGRRRGPSMGLRLTLRLLAVKLQRLNTGVANQLAPPRMLHQARPSCGNASASFGGAHQIDDTGNGTRGPARPPFPRPPSITTVGC